MTLARGHVPGSSNIGRSSALPSRRAKQTLQRSRSVRRAYPNISKYSTCDPLPHGGSTRPLSPASSSLVPSRSSAGPFFTARFADFQRALMSTDPIVHDVAQTGFGKGTNELYDKARPSYPSAALSAIKAAFTSESLLNVLEIGSGTGIFTRAFLAHPEFSTAVRELRAVEPSEGMREQFSRAINDPRVSVEEGTFDRTHVPDGWADLIVVAQAFHWCPDYDRAITEFARALSPNGCVILIWNLEDSNTAWVHQVRQLVESYELGTPQYRLGLWREAFGTPSYLRDFQPPVEVKFEHSVKTTTRGVIDRAYSKSYIAIRSPIEKDQISDNIRFIIDKGDDKVWVVEEEGTFLYPYVTTVIVMKKK